MDTKYWRESIRKVPQRLKLTKDSKNANKTIKLLKLCSEQDNLLRERLYNRLIYNLSIYQKYISVIRLTDNRKRGSKTICLCVFYL